jgi:hypothetical protein
MTHRFDVHKVHLWRRASARIYTDLRDLQIPDDARVLLERAHAALNAAADAVQADRTDAQTASSRGKLAAASLAVLGSVALDVPPSTPC